MAIEITELNLPFRPGNFLALKVEAGTNLIYGSPEAGGHADRI